MKLIKTNLILMFCFCLSITACKNQSKNNTQNQNRDTTTKTDAQNKESKVGKKKHTGEVGSDAPNVENIAGQIASFYCNCKSGKIPVPNNAQKPDCKKQSDSILERMSSRMDAKDIEALKKIYEEKIQNC